jgi:16S rRNA (cytosine967-C5)-methyltransferase
LHDGVIERWVSIDGLELARSRALHSIVEPPIIMRGTGIPGTAHDDEGFTVLEQGASIRDVFRDCPDAAVQDPASARAVAATASLNPDIIIDPCAGRGTKSLQLAALHSNALVVAADTHPVRAESLAQAAETVANLETMRFGDLQDRAGTADVLLLDVPCTNSAVLPRRPEARHRMDRANRRVLREKQRQIAADTMMLLAPSGHVLWSTCSLDPEENEQQVEWLCEYHPLTVVEQHRAEPTGLPGEAPRGYRDGAFHALLRRKG